MFSTLHKMIMNCLFSCFKFRWSALSRWVHCSKYEVSCNYLLWIALSLLDNLPVIYVHLCSSLLCWYSCLIISCKRLNNAARCNLQRYLCYLPRKEIRGGGGENCIFEVLLPLDTLSLIQLFQQLQEFSLSFLYGLLLGILE